MNKGISGLPLSEMIPAASQHSLSPRAATTVREEDVWVSQQESEAGAMGKPKRREEEEREGLYPVSAGAQSRGKTELLRVRKT